MLNTECNGSHDPVVKIS